VGTWAPCTRRRRSAPNHRRDLLERQLKHIVQNERQPLGGTERVEDHEQGEPDGIGHQRLLLWLQLAVEDHDGVRQVALVGLLATDVARPQHVQRDARDDGGQPPTQVVDFARVGAAHANPGLLHGVFGFGHRPEQSIRDPSQPTAMLLEAFGLEVLFRHRSQGHRRT
jgi:hypothetical protein